MPQADASEILLGQKKGGLKRTSLCAVLIVAMGETFYEIAYISAATVKFSPDDLRALLQKARTNNGSLGVTGLLVHVDGSFLQVLEGPEEVVLALFNKIGRDPRHNRVLRVFSGHKPTRGFDAWTMGFVEAGPTLDRLPGFNDFCRTGFAHTQYTAALETKVRDLALQFRLGRWRQHVGAS